MDGILALWKEKGMTSHDCVFQLRKLLQTKKVGHTGTLDPNVDGVLPICIGKATKMVEFMTDTTKSYEGEVTLGIATTTEDADGEIVERIALTQPVDTAVIDQYMQKMEGDIIQIPPMYSAVKVNGRKLYEYARANQTVERPKRQVHIFSFIRTSEPVYDAIAQTLSWRFKVTCGKGTYVRTLAVDLGKRLGYPAFMSQLTRTASAGFTKEDCHTLAQLAELPTLEARQHVLQPVEKAFLSYPVFALTDALWQQVKNGAVLPKIKGLSYPLFFTYQDKLVALYDVHPIKENYIKPKKMMIG